MRLPPCPTVLSHSIAVRPPLSRNVTCIEKRHHRSKTARPVEQPLLGRNVRMPTCSGDKDTTTLSDPSRRECAALMIAWEETPESRRLVHVPLWHTSRPKICPGHGVHLFEYRQLPFRRLWCSNSFCVSFHDLLLRKVLVLPLVGLWIETGLFVHVPANAALR